MEAQILEREGAPPDTFDRQFKNTDEGKDC